MNEDKEFEERLVKVSAYFDEWLEKNDNILERPIKEVLGDAFFDGYDKALKTMLQK